MTARTTQRLPAVDAPHVDYDRGAREVTITYPTGLVIMRVDADADTAANALRMTRIAWNCGGVYRVWRAARGAVLVLVARCA